MLQLNKFHKSCQMRKWRNFNGILLNFYFLFTVLYLFCSWVNKFFQAISSSYNFKVRAWDSVCECLLCLLVCICIFLFHMFYATFKYRIFLFHYFILFSKTNFLFFVNTNLFKLLFVHSKNIHTNALNKKKNWNI